jgi:hypothetical protein
MLANYMRDFDVVLLEDETGGYVLQETEKRCFHKITKLQNLKSHITPVLKPTASKPPLSPPSKQHHAPEAKATKAFLEYSPLPHFLISEKKLTITQPIKKNTRFNIKIQNPPVWKNQRASLHATTHKPLKRTSNRTTTCTSSLLEITIKRWVKPKTIKHLSHNQPLYKQTI